MDKHSLGGGAGTPIWSGLSTVHSMEMGGGMETVTLNGSRYFAVMLRILVVLRWKLEGV